jgi:hypothetical protein
MTQSLIYDYDAKALEAFKSGRGQFTYDVDKAAHEKFQTLLSSTGWLTSEKLSDKLLENVKDDQVSY